MRESDYLIYVEQRKLADMITRHAELDDVRITLASGARANGAVVQGLHPLHYAVYEKYFECVKLLLARGADPNAPDDVGYTPVHLAAERGYKDILEMLIDYGGQTALRDKCPSNDQLPPPETMADEPLRLAIKNGHFECSELLLKRGANPNAKYFLGSEINFIDPVTQPEFLDLLLKYGADPDSTDRSGRTPLMFAARHPDAVQAVKILILHGANVNACASARQDHRSVMHYAVLGGNYDVVRLLVKEGAMVSMPPEYTHPHPLDFAILKDDVQMVKLLIDSGANVNEIGSPLIGSALHVACCGGDLHNQLQIVETLLQGSADPNCATFNEEGQLLAPPLGEYLWNLRPNRPHLPELVNILLKYGGRVVMRTQNQDPLGILRSVVRIPFSERDLFLRLLEAGEGYNPVAIYRLTNVAAWSKDSLLWAATRPLPLRHQARLVVRRVLGTVLPDKVAQLPIAPSLKEYLLCQNKTLTYNKFFAD
ncbi:ankyrin-3-like [Paramacrobiotus metropolitanus]|uniref:ankyrin-3-like n=1 Tax=Paramacrobiotus metropolitanus TaxID=2943436 RepID=UPI00244607C2|nr:ankyrin-3-like [Paramacrobiotus metropolitanus]